MLTSLTILGSYPNLGPVIHLRTNNRLVGFLYAVRLVRRPSVTLWSSRECALVLLAWGEVVECESVSLVCEEICMRLELACVTIGRALNWLDYRVGNVVWAGGR